MVQSDLLNEHISFTRYRFKNWIEIRPTMDKTCACIIDQMQEVFERFSYPLVVISDNSPFNSWNCKNYLNWNGIEFVTQEVMVRQKMQLGFVKCYCKKSLKTINCDYIEYLFEYNNTPIPQLHCPPPEILNSKMFETEFPVSKELLEPN